MGGNKTEAIESVAEFTEALTGRLIRKEDCARLRAVVSELSRGLASTEGRWLLCLDNTDDKGVNLVLSELASMTKPSLGWVLVTSRQDLKRCGSKWCKSKNFVYTHLIRMML